ncbi:hypothetical protein HanXRQr2_Chr17g0799541 [Helianthus annuus]|uniref:Uncharacterized protein n=1 Tax=Helianthus annuus TaxID=4232 RepID=A0A9K3DI98_HELAN|nr:hypothetical protein HanXRQr2_Chr17g0799541 [Helianthus annuus]KAJ0812894.1 hypothetical protein HanPSC8_Chr17g0767141 [Helianthus annuus]
MHALIQLLHHSLSVFGFGSGQGGAGPMEVGWGCCWRILGQRCEASLVSP